MNVAVRGVDGNDSATGSATSLLLSLATAGAQVDDYAFAIGEWSASNVTLTNNRTGWTATSSIFISTTLSTRVFYKKLTSTDIANDTLTLSGSNARSSACLICLSGVDTTTPLDAVSPNPETVSEATNDLTNPVAGISPVAAAFVLALQANNFAAGGTGVSWPSGWTKQIGRVSTPTSQRRAGTSIGTYDTNPVSSPVSGIDTIPDTNSHSAAFTFALKPAVAGGPVYTGKEFFPFINAV